MTKLLREGLRATVTAIPAAALFGAIVLAIVFAANAALLPVAADRLEPRIREAFLSGALPPKHVYAPDRRIGALTWNDCLILMMASDHDRPRSETIVSPMIIRPEGEETTGDACGMLHDAVMQGHGDLYEPWPYHRYVSGFVAPAALAVPVLGVEGYRSLLRIVNYAVILAILGTAFLRYARAGTPPPARRRRMLAGVLLFATILVFGGVEFYAQGFGIGLADLAVYALMAWLLFGRPIRACRFRTTAFTAFFFAWITVFEFWTGQIPLAAAAGVGLIGLDVETEEDLGVLVARIMDFLAAAIFTVAAVLGLKLVVATAVFGPDVLSSFSRQLAVRVGNGDFGLVKLVLHLAGRADHIGQGSLVLGLLNGALGTAALLAGWWLLFASGAIDPLRRGTGAALTASVLLLLLWHLVFRNHSTIHSEFMVRTFVWWTAAGWIMLILGLESRRRFDHAREPSPSPDRNRLPNTHRS